MKVKIICFGLVGGECYHNILQVYGVLEAWLIKCFTQLHDYYYYSASSYNQVANTIYI